MANELAIEFGDKHWVVFNAGVESKPEQQVYTAIPTPTRGIPHNFTPGVHSLLNHYCEFVEFYRSATFKTRSDTVDSIMVLPFSPFTQALNPDLEPTADSSLRTCFRDEMQSSVVSGRAYLPDSTPEDTAIVTEPLFRRPCQVSTGDCPFATSYEAMDTFFNACNTLALLARSFVRYTEVSASPERCVQRLHEVITSFVNSSGDIGPIEASWAADALVLINLLYPTKVEVGELALMDAVAQAPPACQQSLCAQSGHVTSLKDVAGVTASEASRLVRFWSSFCRAECEKCAWKFGLSPLLITIIDHDGSHNVTPVVTKAFKEGLERAVRTVWLVYSPDGCLPPSYPHPCHTALSPTHVSRHHIDPIFVGNQSLGIVQRGACVGVKPHSYRQVLAQLMGCFLPKSVCNVAINEGGLGLRVSSDPTILEEDGQERTEKSISPVQTEGDDAAYGKRIDKIYGAVAQKSAWDTNALLCKPLYTAIEPPLPRERRSRAEFGFSQYFQTEFARMAVEGQKVSASSAIAKDMMLSASVPRVAKKVNCMLYE